MSDDLLAAALNGALLAGPTDAARPRACKAARILQTVNADNRRLILAALNDDAWTDRALAKALEAGGHHLGASTLTHHRLGTCCCQTTEQDAA